MARPTSSSFAPCPWSSAVSRDVSQAEVAPAGFDVGTTWHEDEDGGHGAAEEVRRDGRRAEVRQLDLTKLPKAANVVDELIDELGGIDVFVNNAGLGKSDKFLDLSWD